MPIDSDSKAPLLTPNDVARMLKISKAGVYRLIDKRLIRFYKVMGSIRFAEDDITAFLRHNRVESVGTHNYGSTKN